MKKVILFVSAASILLWPVLAHTDRQTSFQITALIYQTSPDIVSVTYGGPDGSGGIVGGTIGGMVTSQFPNATVILKIKGPADFNDDAISGAIRRNFIFKCGDSLSEGLTAHPIAKAVYQFLDGKLIKQSPGPLSANPSDSRLPAVPSFNLEFISEGAGGWVFSAHAEVVDIERAESIKPLVVLDQSVGLRSVEPLLIGAPYIMTVKGKRGKFIYWVALLIEMT